MDYVTRYEGWHRQNIWLHLESFLNEFTVFACSSVEFCLQHLIYRRLKRAARKGVRRGVKFHKALLGMHGFAVQQRVLH